jgi:hypothetical protein
LPVSIWQSFFLSTEREKEDWRREKESMRARHNPTYSILSAFPSFPSGVFLYTKITKDTKDPATRPEHGRSGMVDEAELSTDH